MKTYVPLILLALLAPLPAHAAVDKAGAAQLKAAFGGEKTKALVTPNGDHYDIVLPGAHSPFAPYAPVGNDVRFKAIPAKDGAYLLDVPVPTTLTQRDAAQKPATIITLTAPKLTCLWRPGVAQCDTIDISVGPVRGVRPDNTPVYGLDAFTLHADVTAPETDAATVTAKAVLTGLNLPLFGPTLAQAVRDGVLNLTLTGAPLKSLSGPLPPGTTPLDLMRKAGTTVSFGETYLSGRDLDARLSGKTKIGGDGALTLVLGGLDELARKAAAENPAYAAGMTLLQVAGQAGTTGDGKSQRTYVLSFAPDGGLLLNGAALQSLLPPAPQAQTPTTPQAPAPATPQAQPQPAPQQAVPAPAPASPVK